MNPEGLLAIVTGGANGLGLGIAENLAERGAKVVVLDRDVEALAKLPKNISCRKLDVTDFNKVKEVVTNVVNDFGQIGILVNNAGVIYSEPFVNIMHPDRLMHDYQRFRDSIKVNLDSVFIMTSVVVEKMVMARMKGVIVNISSICASGNEGQTAYSAAKAGVNAMTITWAKELGRFGIRCNAVAPGFICTESTRKALSESAIKHIKENTPLRCLGEVDDVAKAVFTVIENDFINGIILDVNGGLSL